MIQTVFWKCNNFPMTVGLFIGRSIIISLKGEKLHLHALVFNSVALHFLLCDKILVISCQCALMFNILLSTCRKLHYPSLTGYFVKKLRRTLIFLNIHPLSIFWLPPPPGELLCTPLTLLLILCAATKLFAH